MAERLKTFFKGMVTAADFIDGKFTILENDANTQAVVKSIRSDITTDHLKLTNDGFNIGKLTSAEGDALVGKGAFLAIEDIGSIAYGLYRKNDTPIVVSDFDYDDSINEPVFPDTTNTGSGTIPAHRCHRVKDGYLSIRHNNSSSIYGDYDYLNYITLRLIDGEGNIVSSKSQSDICSLAGATAGTEAPFFMERDGITGKIYLLWPATGTSSKLFEYDEANDTWLPLSFMDGTWDWGSSVYSFSVTDGMAVVCSNATSVSGFMYIDIDNQTKGVCEVDFFDYVSISGASEDGGLWLMKTKSGRFLVGGFALSSFLAIIDRATLTGGNVSIPIISTVAGLGNNDRNATPQYSPSPGRLIHYSHYTALSSVTSSYDLEIDDSGSVSVLRAVNLAEYGVAEADAYFCSVTEARKYCSLIKPFYLEVSGIEITED